MKLHRTLVAFSAIALCFALTSYFRLPILAFVAAIPVRGEHLERVDRYDSTESNPIGIHEFPADSNHRVRLSFRFRANSIVGHPNILQTADVNRGLRLELAGNNLGAVYPGRSQALTGKPLSDQIQPGQWYEVAADFQSGSFLRIHCSAGKPVYERRLAHIDCDRIIVGRGFDESRAFDGQIEDLTIRSTRVVGIMRAEFILLALRLCLFVLGACAAWWMAGSEEEAASPVALIEPPLSGPIDPLLTLRSFALLQVVIGHLFVCVFVSQRFPGRLADEPWLRLMAPAPWAGVWVFFTLSGYLMGKGFFSGRYSLSPQRVYRYVSNRFLRITPVYWSAVLAVSLFVCPEIFQLEHLPLLGSILLFDYGGQELINPIGALWSVCTEVQFYALVPLLFWGLSGLVGQCHQRAVKLSGVVLVAGLVARLLTKEVVHREGVNSYIYTPMFANLDMFVLGMLANPVLAAIRSKAWVTRLATVPNALILIGVGYLVSSYFGARVVTQDTDIQRVMIYGPTFVAPFTVLVIVCCELGSLGQARAGIVRRLLILGQSVGLLAYAIYVWHEPILFAVRRLAPTPLSMGDAIKYAVVASFVTWTVAEFIYRTIERPTEKLKKQPVTTGNSGGETATDEAAHIILLPKPTAPPSISKAA